MRGWFGGKEIDGKVLPDHSILLIQNMVNRNPQQRPTTQNLVSHFKELRCCKMGQEKLEAMANLGQGKLQSLREEQINWLLPPV
jgi:hypothetical protein